MKEDNNRALRSIAHMRYIFPKEILLDESFTKHHITSFQNASKLVNHPGDKNVISSITKFNLKNSVFLNKFRLIDGSSPALLISCCSLMTLYTLIFLLSDGWTVYVENTYFTQRYINPIAHTYKYANLHVLESGLQTAFEYIKNRNSKKNLLVTFLDRPYAVNEHVIETSILGEKYFISCEDSILMMHNWSTVCTISESGFLLFSDRRTLVSGVDRIEGNSILYNANILSKNLSNFLSLHASAYLGMDQLATRFHTYYKYQSKLSSCWLLSLLRYSHISNLSGLDNMAYNELINYLNFSK